MVTRWNLRVQRGGIATPWFDMSPRIYALKAVILVEMNPFRTPIQIQGGLCAGLAP